MIDAAEKDLEKCMQGYGGKRTEPGFNSNTCDLLNKVGETLPIILNSFYKYVSIKIHIPAFSLFFCVQVSPTDHLSSSNVCELHMDRFVSHRSFDFRSKA